MDPSNCVGLYHWARNLGATSLADCALRYLCQHFAQVGHSVLVVSNILSVRAINNYSWLIPVIRPEKKLDLIIISINFYK